MSKTRDQTALKFSKRAERSVQSEIRAMSIECDRVGGINLAQGVCDTEAPGSVKLGAQTAIEAGMNAYTRYDGLPVLRSAIAKKMLDYNGIEADPETDIVVSAGSTGSFYCACLALLNPGDEVILFEPYYGYHVNTLWAVDAEPVYVTLRPPDWSFSREELEAAVSRRTRGIVINTPANPSGKVFSRAELECIAALVIKYDLLVFTDEIYEYFLYDGRTHMSPGAMSGMAEQTITISGFSKTFSITGWRIGYSVSDFRRAQMIGYMNDLVYVCAPAPLQLGVAAGLAELESEYYRKLCLEYQRKRDQICDALERCGLIPYVPQGAYYVLADVTAVPGNTSKEKAMFILEKTGVASVPGKAFFSASKGSNLVRFCFAKTDGDLNEACRRLQQLS